MTNGTVLSNLAETQFCNKFRFYPGYFRFWRIWTKTGRFIVFRLLNKGTNFSFVGFQFFENIFLDGRIEPGSNRSYEMKFIVLIQSHQQCAEQFTCIFIFCIATNHKLLSLFLSLIHISEPTRLLSISYAVFCLKKK